MGAKSKNPRASLAALFKASSPPPAVLFLSPDRVRCERFLQMFRDSFGDIEAVRTDAARLDERSLLALREELLSLSLFSPKRRFLIGGIQDAKAAILSDLMKIIEQAPEGVEIICLGTKLPSNSKFLKAFVSKGAAFTFDTPKGAELKRWVEKEISAQGLKDYPDSLVEILIQDAAVQSGDKDAALLDTITAAIEKTALYSPDGEITLDEVRALFPEIPDPNEFELIDAITAGRPGRAEAMTAHLVLTGKNPFLLLALLHRTFASYLQIAFMLQKGASPGEIRRELGMTEWVFGKYLSSVRPYSIAKLKKGLEEIALTDTKLKGRALESDLLLSGLVRRLAP